MKPTVSVIMPAYNHSAYIGRAVESVLAQQGVDFELLVADDGSSDKTADVVRGYSDPRIKLFAHEKNRGACIVTNGLIQSARGDFISLLNSDDFWVSPDKLARQLERLVENPSLGAVFARAAFVDKDGIPLDKSSLSFGTIFDQQNRSQGEWLRRFFESGNCLCHPTVMIRRQCYEELGLYDNRLRQLPDFDMWVRLIKKYPIEISDVEEIAFRIMPGENASSQTTTNAIRTMNEHYFIGSRFFSDVDANALRAGFGDMLVHPDLPTAEHVDIEKGLLFLQPNSQGLAHVYEFLGLDIIHTLLASPSHKSVLQSAYDIDDRWLHERLGRYALFRPDLLFADRLRAQQELVDGLGQEVDRLVHQADGLVRQVNDLTKLTDTQHAINAAILGSRSWRFTAPMRRAVAVLSRWQNGRAR